MKKVGILLLLVLALAACGLAGELYIEEAARTGYVARLTGLELHGENPKLAIVATLDVTNTTPLAADLVSLSGSVSVQGQEQEWKLLDPGPGAAFEPQVPTPVKIEVRILPLHAVGIALSALAGGGLEVRFDGDLTVKAFGVWPLSVDLHDQQTIRPSI